MYCYSCLIWRYKLNDVVILYKDQIFYMDNNTIHEINYINILPNIPWRVYYYQTNIIVPKTYILNSINTIFKHSGDYRLGEYTLHINAQDKLCSLTPVTNDTLMCVFTYINDYVATHYTMSEITPFVIYSFLHKYRFIFVFIILMLYFLVKRNVYFMYFKKYNTNYNIITSLMNQLS